MSYATYQDVFQAISPDHPAFWFRVAEVVGRDALDPVPVMWKYHSLPKGQAEPRYKLDHLKDILPLSYVVDMPLFSPQLREYFLGEVSRYQAASNALKGFQSFSDRHYPFQPLPLREYLDKYMDVWRARLDLFTLLADKPDSYAEDSLWTVLEDCPVRFDLLPKLEPWQLDSLDRIAVRLEGKYAEAYRYFAQNNSSMKLVVWERINRLSKLVVPRLPEGHPEAATLETLDMCKPLKTVPLPHDAQGAEARFYAASGGRVIAVLPDRPYPQIFPAPYSSHVEGQIQWFDRAIESCTLTYKLQGGH